MLLLKLNNLSLNRFYLLKGNVSLKIIEDYVFYIIIFIAILLSFVVVRPFITWLITLESVQLLSYLVSSLIIMLIVVLLKSYINDFQEVFLNLLKITLQCLAAFGILLIVYGSYQRIIKKI